MAVSGATPVKDPFDTDVGPDRYEVVPVRVDYSTVWCGGEVPLGLDRGAVAGNYNGATTTDAL